MNYPLNRVQVYLDPQHVTKLDQMANMIRIKRSQIIRDAVSAVAERYSEITTFLSTSATPSTQNIWLKFAGIGKSKTGTVAQNIDEMYQHD